MAVPPCSGGNSALVDEFLTSGAGPARPLTTATNLLYNSGSEEEDSSGNRHPTTAGAARPHASLSSTPASGGLPEEAAQPLLSRQASSQNTPAAMESGGNTASNSLFLDPSGMTHVVALQRLFVLMIEAQEIITRLQQYGYFPGKQFVADDPSGAVQMLISLMTASTQSATHVTPPPSCATASSLTGGIPTALQMGTLPCPTSPPVALQGNTGLFPFAPLTGRNPAAALFDLPSLATNVQPHTTDAAARAGSQTGTESAPMWGYANAETAPRSQLDTLLARPHETTRAGYANAKPAMMSIGVPHRALSPSGVIEAGLRGGLDSPHFDPAVVGSGNGGGSHQNSSHSRHGRGRNSRRNKAGALAASNNTGGSGLREGQDFGHGGAFAGDEGHHVMHHTTSAESAALHGGGNPTAHHHNGNPSGTTANPSDALLASGGIMACVEFKRSRIRKYACDLEDITPGAYVLVDGDRGTDCGLLVQTTRLMPDGAKAVTCMDGCDVKDEKLKLENGRVLRPASDEDIDRLHNIIANAEAVALKTCRQRCLELGIDIELVDVEYQFDMKKISFFFNCDHSVDFRALVRELYRTFGARIWMENINPKVKNAMPYSNEQNAPGQEGEGVNGGRGHHGGGGYRRRN